MFINFEFINLDSESLYESKLEMSHLYPSPVLPQNIFQPDESLT